MSSVDPAAPLSGERSAAYTYVRTDLAGLVPAQALRVLDLGCSDGSLGAWLRDANPRRRVCGAEWQPELAERAAQRLHRVMRQDLRDPSCMAAWAPEQFDCVIAADVLEHLPDPDGLMEALTPLLAPGASLVLSLPNIRHLSAWWSIFVRGEFPQRQRGLFDSTHLRWYTLRDMDALLTRHGWKRVERQFALRWGDIGGGRANKLLNRIPARWVERLAPVREFLSYQVELRAVRS